MPIDQHEIVQVYRRRASRYDFTANLCYLIGFRLGAYRRAAVAQLKLRPGDTVVEVGCGTGLNFRLLEGVVGPAGRIVGVDLTDAMLAQARRRIEREGWRNVDLVACDAARYEFPGRVGGILSTFALMMVPEYESVIERGARALAPGRRWVVADLKIAEWPGARLCARALVPFYRPFGVTLDLAGRHPWESIARQMKNATVSPRFFGFAYVATGEA
jgi:demethylmenaquinone methyltransferase/2-methoxy-6-polyprenyl-1,4-benzoquinol methylase